MLVELELQNVGFCGGRQIGEPGDWEQGESQKQAAQPTKSRF